MCRNVGKNSKVKKITASHWLIPFQTICALLSQNSKCRKFYVFGVLVNVEKSLYALIKKTILFGNFSQHGGGVFPNPKTFVNLKNSAFLGQKQCFLGKKCTITWYILHISYFIFHISYCIFHIFLDKGFPKGGVRRLGKIPK